MVIWKIHKNWKIATRNSKNFWWLAFFTNNYREAYFLFFSKQKRSPVTFLWNWDAQKYCWIFKFSHKTIDGTFLLPFAKSAPIPLEFCEKLTPQLEFWRSSFSTKNNPKSVQVLRAISLGFIGKHYSKLHFEFKKLRK